MKAYTYQIANWRKVRDRGIYYMDTSIKSGDWILAPTRQLLYAYKYGDMTDSEYTEAYNLLLAERYLQYPKYFEELFEIPELAFGCYCKPGKFCHRLLLIKFLATHTELDYRGELI